MTKRQLQAALAEARSGRKRARVSSDLKRELGAYCAQRRAAGATWSMLVAELGVGENQLRQWSGGASRGGKLTRVRVVESLAASAASQSVGGLCLELPGVARVTGLSITDVVELVKALR